MKDSAPAIRANIFDPSTVDITFPLFCCFGKALMSSILSSAHISIQCLHHAQVLIDNNEKPPSNDEFDFTAELKMNEDEPIHFIFQGELEGHEMNSAMFTELLFLSHGTPVPQKHHQISFYFVVCFFL